MRVHKYIVRSGFSKLILFFLDQTMLNSAVRGFKALGRICSTTNTISLNKSIVRSLVLSTRQHSEAKQPDPRLKYEDDEIDDGDDDYEADFDHDEDNEDSETSPTEHKTAPLTPRHATQSTRGTEQHVISNGNKRPENARTVVGTSGVHREREQWYQSNATKLTRHNQPEREGNLRKRKVAIWCVILF